MGVLILSCLTSGLIILDVAAYWQRVLKGAVIILGVAVDVPCSAYWTAAPPVLCLDTGHYTVGGGDAVALAREAGERVGYVHLKDVDARLADAGPEGRMGFLDAVRDGLFRPLGQ